MSATLEMGKTPIFPTLLSDDGMSASRSSPQPGDHYHSGLSLREHYAGLAMQGMLSAGTGTDRYDRAREAVAHADALIAVLHDTE